MKQQIVITECFFICEEGNVGTHTHAGTHEDITLSVQNNVIVADARGILRPYFKPHIWCQ